MSIVKGDVWFWVAGPRITSTIADNAERAAADAAWPHRWFSRSGTVQLDHYEGIHACLVYQNFFKLKTSSFSWHHAVVTKCFDPHRHNIVGSCETCRITWYHVGFVGDSRGCQVSVGFASHASPMLQAAVSDDDEVQQLIKKG